MTQDSKEHGEIQDEKIKDIFNEESSPVEMSDLEIALKETDKYKNIAHRTAAELENLKRRSLQERDEIRKYGQSQLVIKVLNVLDNFNRAMDLIPNEAVAPGWKDGLDLVKRSMDNLLLTEGLIQIDALGKPFEPAEHEAILFEVNEEQDPGRVLSVVREGYKLNDRVLRAAQVTVSKTP
ncbi:MAG: molecular chaperone GrpE [Chloroflexi bacterium]|jgi:molecular chaperone GrpE|nr:MAG: molecular chaperone GrpE [Chloroflexota bacterium]